MVGTENLIVDTGFRQMLGKTIGSEEIVDTPACVLLTGAEAIAPPRIDTLKRGMEETERIGESGFEKLCELGAFLICETCILTIGLGILQVNFLMRHIEVATHDDGFPGIQLTKIGTESIVPGHAIIKSPQSVLRIGGVDGDEEECRHFKRDDATFLVVLVNAKSVGHVEGLVAGEYGRTGISFLFSIVPVGLIAFEGHVELSGLHLRFLQAKKVGIERCKTFAKAFSVACAQAVYIPRDEFHTFNAYGLKSKYSNFLRNGTFSPIFFLTLLPLRFNFKSIFSSRMKHIIVTLALFLLCLASAKAQPKVQFDQTTQELGTLLWHAPRSATFTFTNKGTSTLIVKDVRTDCGCTVASWTRDSIEPGSSGKITATFDAELLGHFTKRLAVYTNLDKTPYLLSIMGQVAMTETKPTEEFPYKVGDYYLSTDNIEFDDVNRGDKPVFTLQIFNASKKSYHPELMHLPKYLTAKADPELIRPGRMGRVLITLNSNELPSMGVTQTSVYLSRFMGDRVNKATEINVSATLLPDFLDTPSQLALAPVVQIDSTHITLGPLGKKKRAKGELVLRNTGKTPLVIKALQVYNPGIGVSLSKRRLNPGESEKLKISVNANNTYFKGRRRILLITNDPQNPKMVIDVTINN